MSINNKFITMENLINKNVYLPSILIIGFELLISLVILVPVLVVLSTIFKINSSDFFDFIINDQYAYLFTAVILMTRLLGVYYGVNYAYGKKRIIAKMIPLIALWYVIVHVILYSVGSLILGPSSVLDFFVTLAIVTFAVWCFILAKISGSKI